ncbi:uncharacterized protein LOC131694158 [Topomyia yanbarensis]|uniref:uncharacterized protein LOC131694158 n=1 Tax=Topomyia yanbarensis TaxID=2498891 RepID=UPI00273BEF67|nr:uncharacterized protein LOC131694158 [Topomyia yanbarensis]
MELSQHELAELEERLYSSIHHASAEPNVCTNNSAESTPLPTALNELVPSRHRVVSDKAIVNDGRRNNLKLKRYWSSMQQKSKTYPGIQNNKPWSGVSSISGVSNEEDVSISRQQSFTPYQSILGPPNEALEKGGPNIELVGVMPNEEKQRKKKSVQGDGKKIPNINSIKNRKLEQLKKVKAKRVKAQRSRQKAFTDQQRLVATIEIESSSEEDGEYRSPDPIKQESKEEIIGHQDLEDSDPDEVVVIPSAPPPLVCIESTDDEGDKNNFTHPKSKKKKNTKKNSPRCLSPSNSSIMSDDFIGQNDRTRLNDSFIEGMTNDVELDCSALPTVGSLLAGERLGGVVDISRGARAPSISSEGTVATSSDTTDQDKRNSLKKAPTPPIVSHFGAMSKSCSTPKQSLQVKKVAGNSKGPKLPEEDSIYTSTSAKKSKSLIEICPRSISSDESNGGNISSHSKRSKSYHSDASNKSSKKRKNRRQRDSEHYSDEDFASMLTDIVQAISENEEEESSEEDDASHNENQPSTAAVDRTIDLHPDSSNDILEIKDQEPSTISLPQVEQRNTVEVFPSQVPHDINDSAVVCLENDSPPVISLLNESADERKRDNTPLKKFHRREDEPEYCWNNEIRKFYNNSWNCEDFNISTVMFNMPRSSKSWPIVHKDKYPDPPRKEITCNNCGERGHMRYRCQNPPKPRTCYMCGQTGHQEPRCPNTVCLKCGEKTRNFLRGCQSCAREQHMTCHLCGVRGHGQRNCPDKWRRYHSTIEDNKPLTRTFVRNPNAKHCCICSLPGHEAHMCNAALRIFGQLVPTTEVKNYQPVYYINERYRQQDEKNEQKFNMFSDMADYRLNFDGKFAMNEKSFYNRFAKSVGLLDKKKRREERLARRMRREARKRKQAAETTTGDGKVVCNEESKDADPSTKAKEVAQESTGDPTKTAKEDSNYSFSEFFEESPVTSQPHAQEPLPDYIPLTSSETPSSSTLVCSAEQNSDAKIYLTKPHAKILLGPNGAAFLKDASAKFTLKLSVSFQSVGNVLMVNGSSIAQDNFHNELVKYLNDASHQNEQLKNINNVPKLTEKTIIYIVEHLQLLTRPYLNVKNIFNRYQNFDGNAKTADKIRRTLNIVLFGQFGMREGRDHLNKLQLNLKELRNSQDLNVSMSVRNEINQHIRYIFTGYDHANYGDIVNEYEELRRKQKLIKVRPEDLDLPQISPTKNRHMSDNDESKGIDEHNRSMNFLDYIDDDLILNTSDQLIESNNSELIGGYEQRKSNQPRTNPNESSSSSSVSSSNQQQTPKTKGNSSKQQKIDTLLSECHHMVKLLDNGPITAKFDRIVCQAREGHMSKANYRTLLGIHSILKSKLGRRLQSRKKHSS